jgi:hypothetical protein
MQQDEAKSSRRRGVSSVPRQRVPAERRLFALHSALIVPHQELDNLVLPRRVRQVPGHPKSLIIMSARNYSDFVQFGVTDSAGCDLDEYLACCRDRLRQVS